MLLINATEKSFEENLMPYYKETERLKAAKCSIYSVDISTLSIEEKRQYLATLFNDFAYHRILERSLYYKIKALYKTPDEFVLDYDKIIFEEKKNG